jgi:uncharacterized membrane protein YoaK (UPF0700 family)
MAGDTKAGAAGEPSLLPLLFALTAATGLVDAASFLGLGRVFTANMTGNVVLLAFAAAGAPFLSMARSGTALGAFLVGAVVGGRMASRLEGPGRRRWIIIATAVEGGLVALAAVSTLGRGADLMKSVGTLYACIALTGLAMGVRNAVIRSLGIKDLTTTVLTLTVTGLAADSPLAGGKGSGWQRRVGGLVVMFLGAAAGAWLLRFGVAAPLFAASGIALLGAGWLAFAAPRIEKLV